MLYFVCGLTNIRDNLPSKYYSNENTQNSDCQCIISGQMQGREDEGDAPPLFV